MGGRRAPRARPAGQLRPPPPPAPPRRWPKLPEGTPRCGAVGWCVRVAGHAGPCRFERDEEDQ